MRKIEDRTKKMILKIAVVVFCIALIFGGIMIYGRYQMSKIPKLSFQEILEYTTKDNADAVITVGIVKDGQISYKVYGENGKELPAELHTYEIGSLTKTFSHSYELHGMQWLCHFSGINLPGGISTGLSPKSVLHR